MTNLREAAEKLLDKLYDFERDDGMWLIPEIESILQSVVEEARKEAFNEGRESWTAEKDKTIGRIIKEAHSAGKAEGLECAAKIAERMFILPKKRRAPKSRPTYGG